MKQTGQIKAFVTNHHGDVDGFTLKGGVQVHFPPHNSERVLNIAKRGEEVTVIGDLEERADGGERLRARQIESASGVVQISPPKKKKKGKLKGKLKGKGRHPGDEAMEAIGHVQDFGYHPEGDIDGLILQDDTVIKFPKHLGDALQQLVQIGDEVQVIGWRHETPKGDIHLHADRIVATGSGEELYRRDKEARFDLNSESPTNREILDELKSLRLLVEQLMKNAGIAPPTKHPLKKKPSAKKR
ncbi:OB-fold nucleic acid binding domain-containing protein [Planctomicrobium sp. SH668]|uniref:OB-fold nucleic acid binding domain-containing protein n=1 Tax=Planctomicrobium sp. SH668 TaxID=3448126 RepID=UPI003F5BD95A